MATDNNNILEISFPLGSIDVLEQGLMDYDSVLLDRLLKDRTTGNNIKWGTNDYKTYGYGFDIDQEIKACLVTGAYSKLIQPRASKAQEEQLKRTREKAEVFTPSWVCNKQNNMIDTEWFSRTNVFNFECNKSWRPKMEKIIFPNTKGKTWQDYIEDNRLEITCGEAPYLVSRYDSVTGQILPIILRIGLLDRKLRIVSENTDTEADWFEWAEKAFQHTYGYDYQGDNVLLARENLLYSFVDYYLDKFSKEPDRKKLRRIAHIISWNIWQMDGISMTSPFTFVDEPKQMSLDMFIDMGDTKTDNDIVEQTNGIPCRIMDWKANKSIEFKKMIKEKG